ncbi:MAG: substrate-binding domain-containing protein, partial [Paraglaciecola chathamensis]
AHGLSVPKDVSVVGFNDLILAQCIKPKLTTIHNPIEEMAMKATKLALSLSKNSDLGEIESVADKHKYVPVLVQRHSVQEIS